VISDKHFIQSNSPLSDEELGDAVERANAIVDMWLDTKAAVLSDFEGKFISADYSSVDGIQTSLKIFSIFQARTWVGEVSWSLPNSC
jgi:hypothetical protein